MICTTCRGYPHRRDDGCATCDDTGEARVEHEDPAPRRPLVHRYATERAIGDLRRRYPALRREESWRGDLATAIATALAYEAASPVQLVIGRVGCRTEDARDVIATYCASIREHARALRGSPRRRDQEGDARNCDAHADRIEQHLPRLMRAAS